MADKPDVEVRIPRYLRNHIQPFTEEYSDFKLLMRIYRHENPDIPRQELVNQLAEESTLSVSYLTHLLNRDASDIKGIPRQVKPAFRDAYVKWLGSQWGEDDYDAILAKATLVDSQQSIKSPNKTKNFVYKSEKRSNGDDEILDALESMCEATPYAPGTQEALEETLRMEVGFDARKRPGRNYRRLELVLRTVSSGSKHETDLKTILFDCGGFSSLTIARNFLREYEDSYLISSDGHYELNPLLLRK
ncbi:MAG: hypothetical protein GY861_06395 [bacterium]|nr:hypothetical protein [bacterium]